MSGNNIHCDAADVLAEVILQSKCLKKLRLSNNNFGRKDSIAIATALQSIATLKMLDLEGNNIDYAACS